MKTSLQGNSPVPLGLSLTAARLVKETTAEKQRGTREAVFCFSVVRVASCPFTELRCESENWAAKGLSGNVQNVELF